MGMTTYACDKPGCGRAIQASTQRQLIARMGAHWTAADHEDFVREILEAEGAARSVFLGAPSATPAFGSTRAPSLR